MGAELWAPALWAEGPQPGRAGRAPRGSRSRGAGGAAGLERENVLHPDPALLAHLPPRTSARASAKGGEPGGLQAITPPGPRRLPRATSPTFFLTSAWARARARCTRSSCSCFCSISFSSRSLGGRKREVHDQRPREGHRVTSSLPHGPQATALHLLRKLSTPLHLPARGQGLASDPCRSRHWAHAPGRPDFRARHPWSPIHSPIAALEDPGPSKL